MPNQTVRASIFACVYSVVHNIYKWTDIPAQNGETGLWKRNWRTWLGHSTVAAGVVALGRWLGLHVSFFWPVVGLWIPIVAAAAVGLFYFWREFGINGDYWNRKKGYDSQSDSVLDFWIVLPPIFILMQVPMVYAVLTATLMIVGLYLLSLHLDYNG